MTADEAYRILHEADCLATGPDVTAAIARLAAEITVRLADADPVVLCVMHGGVVFAGQLLTQLQFPLEVGYVHAGRYGDDTEGGGLEWMVRPRMDLDNRTVLLVDDILDVGVTLSAIAAECRLQGAAAVLTAVLVDKRHERKISPGLRADFTGLEVEDRFLFGYGLDYKGYWRNAPGIYAVKGL